MSETIEIYTMPISDDSEARRTGVIEVASRFGVTVKFVPPELGSATAEDVTLAGQMHYDSAQRLVESGRGPAVKPDAFRRTAEDVVRGHGLLVVLTNDTLGPINNAVIALSAKK